MYFCRLSNRVYEGETSKISIFYYEKSPAMSLDSLSNSVPGIGVFPRKAFSIAAPEDCHIQTVTVYLHAFNPESLDQRIKVEFHKRATTEELIEKIFDEKRSGNFLLTLLWSPIDRLVLAKSFGLRMEPNLACRTPYQHNEPLHHGGHLMYIANFNLEVVPTATDSFQK